MIVKSKDFRSFWLLKYIINVVAVANNFYLVVKILMKEYGKQIMFHQASVTTTATQQPLVPVVQCTVTTSADVHPDLQGLDMWGNVTVSLFDF